MIRKIFLPNKIDSYYLFKQRIVAFEVTREHIFATVLTAHREKRVVEKFIEESWDINDAELSTATINKILKQIGQYDQVHVALPSGAATFKEIELPFKSPKKIKLILPFEVESLLPFSLKEASIDAIIKPDKKNKESSNVFFVALKHSTLERLIEPFIASNIIPDKITIGVLELYGLYKTIDEYSKHKGVISIVDMGVDATHVILLVDGRIKAIRTLQRGVDEELARLDLTTTEKKLDKNSAKFFSDIKFSIEASLRNENIIKDLNKLFISGVGSEISGIANFMKNLMNCQAIIFHPHKVIHKRDVSMKDGSTIPNRFTISLATALSSKVMEKFDLGTNYRLETETKLFKLRIITAGVLVLAMFLSFFAYSIFTSRKIKNEIERSSKEVVGKLTKEFNLRVSTGKKEPVSSVISDAKRKLATEENIWFALSPTNRYSFLHYLEELFTRIDRTELQLKLKRLSIKSDERSGADSISMEGQVKDYDALRKLEGHLRDSKLFREVPELQEIKFNISLLVRENGREG